METEKRKPVAPYYVVAVLWLLYALVFPLYTGMHYMLLAVVSAVVFGAVWAICSSAGQPEAVKPAEPPKKAEKPASTGNEALDKMLQDGRLAIAEMKRLDENIADPGISADIVRLEQISQKIFDEVKQNPRKLPQIRRFMDYYLPTTLKLLNSYDRMSGAGVSGENIDSTLARVEGMMRTIVAAFEKQLDSLYGAEALDISTDITVLETMMAREGLTDGPMQPQPPQEAANDIQLEL